MIPKLFFSSRITLCLITLGLLSAACAQNKDLTVDQQVDELLGQMTLEEKVGQMNQYNGFWDLTGPAPDEGEAAKKYENLSTGMVGSVLNVRGVEDVEKMQKLAVEETRLGIPLIFAQDVIHGHITLAPIPLAEAASWDLAAIEKSASMAAREAAARGLNWTFAPNVDLVRDPRWGRVMEGAGEDPYLGSLIARARVRGFQGDDLADEFTIAACAKHFAAYGFAEAGREYNTADLGTNTLYNMVFPPFRAAIDEGLATVMNSFNVLNNVPATGDAWLQRTLLKGDWQFEGVVVSDWGSTAEMIDHGFAKDLKDATTKAVNAGMDIDMESYGVVNHLVDAVKEGRVKVETVDEAVKRILKLKFELGLMDDPYKYCNANREKAEVGNEEQMEAALDMAKKSMVLLKNDNDMLPLSDADDILIIGDLADDKTSVLGSWRISSKDESAISVLEGMAKYREDIPFRRGVELYSGLIDFSHEVQINNTDRTGIEEAVEAARSAKKIVMVLGEHGFQSGEGRSRTDIGLPGLQQELLEAVHAVNPNIVLVLLNGRPLTIPWADQNVPAILEAWQPGTRAGDAIAQVLYGEYNPSGKLPMTFPRHVGQIPIYYNQLSTGRPGPKEMVWWSHFQDMPNSPLYPFGFGLSYTTFEYKDLTVDASDPKAVEVSVEITNTGTRVGEEVVQLYIHDRVAKTVRPEKELKGFNKNVYSPGESKTVTFTLTDKELGFYDNQGNWNVEPGVFDIMVGTSSAEGLSDSFELK